MSPTGSQPAQVNTPVIKATIRAQSNFLVLSLGVFACVPPGAVCCSDGISYAVPPDTCQGGADGRTGAAGARAGTESGPGARSDNENDNDSDWDHQTALITTGPAQPGATPGPDAGDDADDEDDGEGNGFGGLGGLGGLGGPGLGEIAGPPGPGQSVSHFGQHWFTFSITWHYWSYFYSRVGHENTMLHSSQVECTTELAVSATNAAQASEYFTSISATVVLSTPVQTETPVVTWAPAPTPVATAPVEHGLNGTAPSHAPSVVVTAGAANLGGLAGVMAGVCGLVLGVAVGML